MKNKKIVVLVGIIFFIAIIGVVFYLIFSKNTPKTIELNSENFEDYFIFDVSIDDFNVQKSGGLFSSYKGTAKLNASAKLKKDVKLENVTVNGKIITSGLCWAGNVYSFTLDFDKDGKAEYSKTITTGDAGMLYPEEPKLLTIDDVSDGEFILEGAYLKVSGSIIE